MCELEYSPLSKLCDPERGITYGIVKVGDFVSGGVRVIRGGDIRNGRIVFDAEKKVSEEISRQFQRTILRGGEIVINLIAEPGHTAIVPTEFAGANVSRDVGVIPLNNTVDHRYVDYYLKSPMAIEWLTARLQGSVTQKINLGTLNEMPVPIPPLEEQSAISHILGTLDDKIELNRRVNETMQAMVRAIFKSWFVDFDPVHAKAEGRDPGLFKSIADLFPDRFEDSQLGEIPIGWRVSTIRELTSSIQYGLTQSASAKPTGPKFLRITDIQGGRVDWGTVPYCNVSPEEYKRYRLKSGDIVVARTGASTGENIYLSVVPDAVFASYLVRFQFDDPAIARLIGAFMRTPPYFDFVAGSIGGSAQPNASAQVLAGAQFVVPTREIAWRFSELARPLDRRVAANNDESRTLTALRDALLPKLLSGKLLGTCRA